MKVLFQNRTTYTAYIAIVDYDQKLKYTDVPVVFELEAGAQCFYEATSYYLFGGLVSDKCKYWGTYNTNNIDIFLSKQHGWQLACHNNLDVNLYLLEHPEVTPAKLSNDDNAMCLKNYMFSTFTKKNNNDYYNAKKPHNNLVN